VLRLFYACYFAGMGTSVPFFPPYLRSLGLSGRQISFMLALAPMLHLCVPLGWGWLADRTRRPDLILRLVCLTACLLMVPLVFVRSMPAMLFLYAGYQAFAVPIIGLTDAIALERVRQGADYGRIRMWGSLAFALSSVVVGRLLDWRGRTGGDPLVPAYIAGTLGCAFLVSLTLRGQGTHERPHASEIRTLLRDRRFLFLLVVAPLHWACAAPYHGFLGILFRDRHLPQSLLGTAFLISVGAEIATLYFFARLRARFMLAPILIVTFAVSSVRWALVGTVQDPRLLVALQATHALTFGAFWGSALSWVGECVPPRLRATGQTLFTGVLYGVGNGFGMLASGALYDAFHGAEQAFLIAAGFELVPLALMISLGRRLDPLRPASPPPGS
jgi:MFS transporter, PPP family, 3-phenylpropionic acid transporter